MSVIKQKSGSIMVMAIVLALITGALVGGFLSTITMEIKDSHRARMSLQAINLAEAGLEFALDAMNNSDWTDWKAGAKGYYRESFPLTARSDVDRTTRSIRVYVEPNGSPPAAVAEAVIRAGNGVEVRRQVYIQLGQRSLFASGLVARNTVKFSGNNVYIDSYRSSNGAYHVSLNSFDNGSVASLKVTADAILLGNGNVWGRVATGGSNPNIGPNGSVRGADTPSGMKVDLNRIALDFYAELPPPVTPDTTGATTNVSGTTIGSPSTASVYVLEDLEISGKTVVTIEGDVLMIIKDDLSISGNARIDLAPNSTLIIHALGEVDATGNGIVNMNNRPETLQIYGSPTENGETIKIAGNGGFYGVVYAPNNDVVVVGNGEFFGALVGNNLTFTGNASFHYDEDLADFGDDGIKRITEWVELTDAGQRKNMSTILNDGF